MARVETCKFHTKANVTASNKADIERVMRVRDPNASCMVGDTVTLDYSVHVTYLGQVAECLEAMIRLKADFVGDQSSTDVLIKRVFRAFDKAIN